MLITNSTNISTEEAVRLIENARNAELCRNLEASQKILGAVLENLDEPPRIKGLETRLQAEILRLCGFFLNNYGRSRNLRNYQERGTNFLTTAVEMFELENLPDQSAEAKIMLALCYWHEGAIAECETILSVTEAQFENDRQNPVYLQLCINRLMTHYWKKEFQQGLEIIENLAPAVEQCSDARIRTLYHNQAGIIYRALRQPEKAIHHLNEAIEAARASDNLLFAAGAFNNLGNAYKDVGEFELAHRCVDDSVKLFREFGEFSWQAYPLDTKAQIYFAQSDFAAALDKADEALAIYRETNDYAGRADSLFTKIKILLRTDRLVEAIILLEDLIGTCRQQIGEFAMEKYATELAKLIHPVKNLSYPEENRQFKTKILKNALRENDFQVTKAAVALGISHQNLSDILNNQFPELYEELGIRRRAPRNSLKKAKAKKSARADKSSKKKAGISHNRITPINFSHSEIAGLPLSDNTSYFTFVMHGSRPPQIKLKRDVVVLVENSEAGLDVPVIVQNRKSKDFHCGFFEKDEWTDILYFKDTDKKDGVPILLDDLKYYGKIIGFCRLDKTSDKKIKFKALS